MSDEKYCLRWNDFESNISSSFKELRDEKELFDVWLSCDNGQVELPAHKLILSACSAVLKHLLRRKSGSGDRGGCSSHVLYLRGVQSQDLEYILNFMYNGEVSLAQDQLNSFLAVAEDLQIKGLTQNSSESNNPRPSASNSNMTQKQSFHRRTNQSKLNQRTSDHPVSEESYDDIEEVENIKCEPSSNYEYSNQLVAQDDQSYEASDQMYQEDMTYQDQSGAGSLTTYIEEVEGGFMCQLCSKIMKFKHDAKRHIKMQHAQSGNEQISCDYCSKTLKHHWALGDHMRRIHGLSAKQK